MSLKRPGNQTRISDFFGKRFKSDSGTGIEDNICQAAESTPGCSGFNETTRDNKHVCTASGANLGDGEKKLGDTNIQKEEPDIIPSSPTLEFSEDINEISDTESHHSLSSAGSVLDAILSTERWSLAKDELLRLKPDDLDIDSFENHVFITEQSPGQSEKFDASKYVKMPFYVLGMQGRQSRWDVIKSSLAKCGNVKTGKDLESVIRSYNQTFTSKMDFSGFDNYLDCLSADERVEALDTLKRMADLAVEAERLCKVPIPILCQQKDQAITMSQHLIAALLANAFFCTFSSRNNLPSINFTRLFAPDPIYRRRKFQNRSGVSVNKLRCLFHYFNRVTASMPDGSVTFHRQVLKDSDVPKWSGSETCLTELYISSKGNIEDEQSLLQVDFANMWVGGGVLGTGCVQEEIRFMITPELIISRLFTEVLDPNECIIVTGCETFSTYRGYAGTFEWSGNYVDQTPRDKFSRRLTQVVMIDAIQLQKKSSQFTEHLVERELNKAYCGFYCAKGVEDGIKLPAVATGNWGCGVFGGDIHLKFLIQLMAAAEAGRDVCYFTFDDVETMNTLYKTHSLLKPKNQQSVTVGKLYKIIKSYEQHVSQRRKWSQWVQPLCDYIETHFHSGSFASSPEQTDDDDDDC